MGGAAGHRRRDRGVAAADEEVQGRVRPGVEGVLDPGVDGPGGVADGGNYAVLDVVALLRLPVDQILAERYAGLGADDEIASIDGVHAGGVEAQNLLIEREEFRCDARNGAHQFVFAGRPCGDQPYRGLGRDDGFTGDRVVPDGVEAHPRHSEVAQDTDGFESDSLAGEEGGVPVDLRVLTVGERSPVPCRRRLAGCYVEEAQNARLLGDDLEPVIAGIPYENHASVRGEIGRTVDAYEARSGDAEFARGAEPVDEHARLDEGLEIEPDQHVGAVDAHVDRRLYVDGGLVDYPCAGNRHSQNQQQSRTDHTSLLTLEVDCSYRKGKHCRLYRVPGGAGQ